MKLNVALMELKDLCPAKVQRWVNLFVASVLSSATWCQIHLPLSKTATEHKKKIINESLVRLLCGVNWTCSCDLENCSPII